MTLRSADFESAASASSTIPAREWESAFKVSHSTCLCAKAFRYWGALPAVALFLYPHAEAFPAKPPWPVAAAGIRRRNSHYSRNLGLDPAFHTSRCRLNVTVVRQLRQS